MQMQIYAERKHGSTQMSESVWLLHGDVTLQRQQSATAIWQHY
jgi:hypothetical protein